MNAERPPVPWFCDRRLCIDKSQGYWISVHGVVACSNCTPPAFPELVKATGPTSSPPLVLADRTTTAATATPEGATAGGKAPQTPARASREAGTGDGTTPAPATARRKPAKTEPTLW